MFLYIYLFYIYTPPPRTESNWVVTDETSMVYFSLWVLWEVCEVSSSQYNFQLCVMKWAIDSHSSELLPVSHASRFLLPVL